MEIVWVLGILAVLVSAGMCIDRIGAPTWVTCR